MTDTTKDTERAAHELRASTALPATSIDAALSPGVWDRYVDHVKAGAVVPEDGSTPTVPMLIYGDGPHDYISTDFDAGTVIIRDGNDPTGRAWKFDDTAFRRFVARSRGEKLPGDEPGEDDITGEDNPAEAATKLARRTARKVEQDERATPDKKADRA